MEALRAAMLALIERKPFNEISIKEITDTAGLSYPTFFRRYAGKEQILEDIAAEEVRRLLSLGRATIEEPDRTGSSARLCDYVHAHRRLWKALLTGGAEGVMRTEFIRIAREIAQTRPRQNPWIPDDLAPAFVTSGIFEILAWWMRQPDDYPIARVIKLFDALIVEPAARPRKIELD